MSRVLRGFTHIIAQPLLHNLKGLQVPCLD
nr:MAG TPA: hypothetical protein [Caudoviricetes sp.]